MSTGSFSFGFKKHGSSPFAPTRISKLADQPKQLSGLFESQSARIGDDVQSRSTIISLSTGGFEGTVAFDDRRSNSIIPCRNRLPEPSRETKRRQIGEALKVHKDSHKHHHRPAVSYGGVAESESNKESGPPADVCDIKSDDTALAVKASDVARDYGLTNDDARGSSDDDETELGPPIAEILDWRKQQKKQSELLTKPILAANAKLFNLRKEHKADEISLFRQELETLPNFSPASYDVVDVESFGLAMLKGMGYDENKHTTKPAELHKRVYQRAGLGADKEFELLERKQTEPAKEIPARIKLTSRK